jgi:pimeloyl-ACP methyl ester carboxylesterase
VAIGSAPHDAAQLLAPWPGEQVETPAGRLHVRRGRRPERVEGTAVYVHGLGGAATNWTDLMGLLGDTLTGYAPDLPGFGWSDPPPHGDYSLRAHADVVTAFLEHLAGRGETPVHLFGNSLGGAVVTRVAAVRSDLVRTLVLVAPALPSYRPRPTNVHLPLVATPLLGDRLGRLLARRSPEQQVRDVLSLCYADASAVPAQRREEAVVEARRRGDLPHAREALMESLRGLMRAYFDRGPQSLWRLAALVESPTLLLYGMRDKLVDPRSSRRAVRTFPHARLVRLATSGHVPQMEHPEVVERAVREHLAADVPW